MKFVIDRKTWRRGGNNHEVFGPTRLLNDKGNMCCLGHIARQCGVPEEHILNIPHPEYVSPEHTHYHSVVTIDGRNNILTVAAMSLNDSRRFSDAEREQKLIELFADHGHELQFVG